MSSATRRVGYSERVNWAQRWAAQCSQAHDDCESCPYKDIPGCQYAADLYINRLYTGGKNLPPI